MSEVASSLHWRLACSSCSKEGQQRVRSLAQHIFDPPLADVALSTRQEQMLFLVDI